MERIDKLIRLCVQNDRNAQRHLYEHYAPAMLGVCLRYSKNREDAEELLQEGFLKAFKKIEQYRFEGSFEGWLRRIMANVAMEKLRSSQLLHPILTLEAAATDIQETEILFTNIAAKELLQMVQQLTPTYRMVFNLYVFEGYKHREIAAMLGVSEGTSKSNLADARAALQKMLTKRDKRIKENLI